MRLLCFGVREVEKPFFIDLNQKFGYDIELTPELPGHASAHLVQGFEALMLRGVNPIDRELLIKYKEAGVKYVLTRTVGYSHIDLEAAKELGLKVAYVPFYSPNAIAELAVSLAMMLSRHTAYTVAKTHQGDYTIEPSMFAKEVRKSTVGIIGLGKIGFTAATLFKGLGANVIGYDVVAKDYLGDVCKQVSLDELLAQSDIISVHVPYFKGSNDNLINAEFLSKMKNGAVLVNTSRGELQDIDAILDAVESGRLMGFATDVLKGETAYFNKKHEKPVDAIDERLRRLYPKVLVTPHLGSYTDEAVTNMVEVSYENLKEFIETGKCKNELA